MDGEAAAGVAGVVPKANAAHATAVLDKHLFNRAHGPPTLTGPTGYNLPQAALDLRVTCSFLVADWVVDRRVTRKPPRSWAAKGVLYIMWDNHTEERGSSR